MNTCTNRVKRQEGATNRGVAGMVEVRCGKNVPEGLDHCKRCTTTLVKREAKFQADYAQWIANGQQRRSQGGV